MENKYKKTKYTTSFLQYYFVFCSRNKRKIFDVPGVEERFKELVYGICNEFEVEIISIKCKREHVRLRVYALPNVSPLDIMNKIKLQTSTLLREEFLEISKMPSLWTRNFWVSVETAENEEMIQEYINAQRSRYDKE